MRPSAVTASLINNVLRVRRDFAAIDVVQALTEVRPLGSISLVGSASATLHCSEKMLEQHPLLRRKHGHLFNEFCCAHGVNLAQPRDRANHDFQARFSGRKMEAIRWGRESGEVRAGLAKAESFQQKETFW